MKGISRFVSRTPHMFTSKVGLSKKSNDPEFDEYNRSFEGMEKAVEGLLKDAKVFAENVVTVLESGAQFADTFGSMFQPKEGEYDLMGRYPDAAKTSKNTGAYAVCMQELKDTLSPELDLIETRIVVPTKEFQYLMKCIRKNLTKRDHKLIDYDRHNNSLTKLRDKKEKNLNDEKNLFKLEQEFELATQEYDAINTALKNDLPQFMVLATRFIDPLFHSFYYMQLNIYYLMMEKLQGFATECKYRYETSSAEILSEYQDKRGDVWEQVDALHVTKRQALTAMRLANRQNSGASGASGATGLSRATTSASTSSSGFKKAPPPPPGSSSSVGLKKMPPPPPGGLSVKRSQTSMKSMNSPAMNNPPPPYSAGNSQVASVVAATKRPPPPPPVKKAPPKPKVQYVVALYDFDAQADGDLSFRTGDRIEVVERTANTEDWWKGRLNGEEGVFPGNYVQDA
ncbi:BAR-domain-containing protein [Serendipita vermifera]|nr:BAR-domain-containing protein [Serendipita vermifera]